MVSMEELLNLMVQRGGSDLHLSVGSPPKIRIDGKLVDTDYEPLMPEATKKLVYSVLSVDQVAKFEKNLELDFSFGVSNLGRFRTNAFLQRGTVAAVLRVIPFEVYNFETIGLPAKVCESICNLPRGLVLCTGATGAGKSTTLASMVNYINETRQSHIVTIEDPIEILHPDRGCIVNQREVGLDTVGFEQALRRVLRQDPDIILIGELRDTETAQTALQAAESGHLVFSTLYTIDCAETIGRMIELFPPAKQEQVRSILAGTLRGVVSQRLLPKANGGRVPAVEVMVTNSRVQELIRENRPDEIIDAIEDGDDYDMQSFAKSLIDLVVSGDVDRETAANAATNRHDFLVSLERAERDLKAIAREEERAAQAAEGTRTSTPLHGLRVVQ